MRERERERGRGRERERERDNEMEYFAINGDNTFGKSQREISESECE